MLKTYRTSRPEINKLFTGSLPQVGLTLLTGDPSGMTIVALDIVRETLKSEGRLLILSPDTALWQRAFGLVPNLTVRTDLNQNDNLSMVDLVVADNVLVSAPLIRYSDKSPMLVMANSLTTQTAFNQLASLILRIDPVNENLAKVSVVKSRYDHTIGAAEVFKVDPILGLVAQNYAAPAIKSAIDRLLEDEDLV